MKRLTPDSFAALAGLALAACVSGAGGEALGADPPRAPGAATASKKKPKAATDADAAPREPTREERIDQARQLFAAAEEKLGAGDVAGALAGYRAANDVIRSAQAIFKIAICIEKMGSRAEAEDAFHRFLGMPPPESMIDERHVAEEHLADLAKGTLKISSQPKAIQVELDGKPGYTTPVELRLLPGKHVVVASAPDYEPATNEVEVTKGGVMELSVSLRSASPGTPSAPSASSAPAGPVAPPPPAPSAGISPTIAGGVAVGLAAVGVGLGAGFGVRALSAQSDYNRTPTQALADKQKTSAVISDSSFAAAAVFAIVGTVFLTHRAPAAPAPAVAARAARLSLVPVVSPRVEGVAAVLRF